MSFRKSTKWFIKSHSDLISDLPFLQDYLQNIPQRYIIKVITSYDRLSPMLRYASHYQCYSKLFTTSYEPQRKVNINGRLPMTGDGAFVGGCSSRPQNQILRLPVATGLRHVVDLDWYSGR